MPGVRAGLALVLLHLASSPLAAAPGPELGGTFSIVAFDPSTGDVGVAVQSHWFSVGAMVPWARAGVGAVATQSFVEVSYGPKLLERMARGEEPGAALEALIEADSMSAMRQVGAVDCRGAVASHTGSSCVVYAGGVTHAGPGATYTCQGNLLASASVWTEMARAFEAGAGHPLAERMLRALEAGQAAGGDARGMQSAALIVERPISSAEPWKNRWVDLRVEDSGEPIAELRRLYTIWVAYKAADRGDSRLAAGDWAGAYACYDSALAFLPDNDELIFWRGSMGTKSGRPDQAVQDVKRAIELNPRWRTLIQRLDEEIFPGISRVRRELGLEP